MADASDQPRPAAPAAGPRTGWLLWLLLVFAWLSVAFWGWQAVERLLPVRMPRTDLRPLGAYDTVAQWVGPISCRLETLDTVRLAGVAPPAGAAEGDRARARLEELAPPGTPVYVEPEPFPPPDGDAATAASVFLPPRDGGLGGPFPYGEASLLAAVLVQEGLVRADVVTPYRYREELGLLEDDARRHRRGLWSAG